MYQHWQEKKETSKIYAVTESTGKEKSECTKISAFSQLFL
jgi:hypothetical protein